jgi:ribosomal-protein-alanine N-acetyltransferase
VSLDAPGSIELRTARLLLRPPALSDADAYFRLASDPEFARYAVRGPATRESIERRLARVQTAPWPDQPELAVLLDGVVVGRVTLGVDHPNQAAALGYGIARELWGRGLATEAARAVLDHAFLVLGMAKVWARADPRNVGSLRVLEKLGMTREGVLRSHVIRNGERADQACYGILRVEWEAARLS